MPCGRLTERYVQEFAIVWLEAQFRERTEVQAVVGVPEVRVRAAAKLGRGRADGLVAAELNDGNIHIASIEAKSSRTLFSAKHRYKNHTWFLHSLAVGLIGPLCSLAVGWYVGHWFLLWVLPFILFAIFAVGYSLLMSKHQHYQVIDVVDQVRRYPANEQWIALSTDAYNRLGTSYQAKLHSSCKVHGIGLICVSSAKHVRCLETARPKQIPTGLSDFLICYDRETTIRQALQSAKQPIFADAVDVPT